jgi:hypothetical protein
MEQFKRSKDLQDFINENTGFVRIEYKVHGYWSRDTITLYIRRNHFDGGEWGISISTSSGGRDELEVKHDHEAVLNYAAALQDAATIAKGCDLYFTGLEQGYQNYVFRLKEAEKEEQRQKQAKIDADPALGLQAAELLVFELTHKLKARQGGEAYITSKNRGTDHKQQFEFKLWDKASFKAPDKYGSMSRVKKQEFIAKLAEQSATFTYRIV